VSGCASLPLAATGKFGYGTGIVSSPRRLVFVVVAAVVALGLGGYVAARLVGDRPERPPSARVVQPGAPGQPGRTLSSEELSSLAPPRFTIADTLFMQRMIVHHGQALEMAALVKGRNASPDLPPLAGRIEVSQRDEIAQMRRWLGERGQPAPGTPGSHAEHSDMPGMLTPAELSRLGQARGPAFDRLFLELMIRHHRGALTMVQELYAAGGGLEPASDRFAREVNADQNIEINRMRQVLAKLG
jgi:uncharacterized protein (DUF305 family)